MSNLTSPYAEVIEAEMTPGSLAKNATQSRQPAMAGAGQFSIFHNLPSWLEPLLVFVLGFSLRVAYAMTLEHLVFQNGDAYYFLSGGSNLLSWATTLLHGDFASAFNIGHASATDAEVMRSTSLPDRMMNDGPVMTTYSAVMNLLAGTPAGSVLFNVGASKFMVLNGFVDGLNCVLVYLIGRAIGGPIVGRIAGLLFAFYPAAILNVHSFYSEPFCATLLSAWLLSLAKVMGVGAPGGGKSAAFRNVAGFGALTGLVMLSKPLFLYLPPFALLIVGLRSLHAISDKKRALGLVLALFFGLSCVFGPWFLFTKNITGRVLPGVCRSPSFNLFLGNDIERDGWRAYPFQTQISSDVREVLKSVKETAFAHPREFLALQLKKVPRMWAGVWNEYRYNVLGVPLSLQEFYHQMLLFAAALGAVLLTGIPRSRARIEPSSTISSAERRGYNPIVRSVRPRLSQSIHSGEVLLVRVLSESTSSFALVLVTVVLAHCAYCLFEPISRYAFSAIPSICIMAAFAIAWLRAERLLLRAVGLFAAAVTLLRMYPVLNAFLEQFYTHSNCHLISALLVALASGLAFFAACFWANRRLYLEPVGKLVAASLVAGLVLTTTVAIAQDREIDQRTRVIEGQTVSRAVFVRALPANTSHAEIAYALIDMVANHAPCPVELEVNGTTIKTTAAPWLSIRPNSDYLEVLPLHLQGMGNSLMEFRQWWAIPVPVAALKLNESNLLSIKFDSSAVTVYGANRHRDGGEFIPSTQLVSWTKGFTTADRRDGRIFEQRTRSNSSSLPGGFEYNIEVVVPASRVGAEVSAANSEPAVASESASATPAISGSNVLSLKQKSILGSNPMTAQLDEHPLSLPTGCDLGRFVFSCDAKSLTPDTRCALTIAFSGTLNGEPTSWQSTWQPAQVTLKKNSWKHVSFTDTFPDALRRCSHVQARVQLMPFDADMLFLNRRKAARQAVEIRDVRLDVFPANQDLADKDIVRLTD